MKRTHFPDDMVLRDLVDTLNDTVIEALTKFIAYLLPKHQGKYFAVLTCGIQATDHMEECSDVLC